MSFRRLSILAGLCLLSTVSVFAQKKEKTDSLVRLLSAQSVHLYQQFEQPYRKVIGPARFLHNDTFLVCDTAIWNVNKKVINAWGNVQVIQEETVLTSDKLDYFVDDDLAQFRGGVVQLIDKDGNTLRTRHLDYNTKDSTAIFKFGGAMKGADGQVIESSEGTYDSKAKFFRFDINVNMYADTMYIKTSTLLYHTDSNVADFDQPIDVWNDDNMLSSNKGWYDRNRELFFFTDNVHILTEDQEAWTDSLYFYRAPRNAEMFGQVQLRDTTRNVVAMSQYLFYHDSLSTLTLRSDVALRSISTENEKTDTVYLRSDKVVLETLPMCNIPSEEIKQSKTRLDDINTDPVGAYRRKAYEEAEKKRQQAREEADKKAGLGNVQKTDDSEAQKTNTRSRRRSSVGARDDESASADSLGMAPAVARSLGDEEQEESRAVPPPAFNPRRQAPDSIRVDSLIQSALQPLADSLAVPADSLVSAPADSLLSAPADSLASVPAVTEPQDSTKINFVTARGNVKIWRADLQIACDSLRYTDLDSLARFYQEPVIWNDGNRQYHADSISVQLKNKRVHKASLMSDAFVAIKEDEMMFDQIRSAEILAFFDSTMALTRFDALGGANALFYLQENGAFATVNKSECKMMSANFFESEIQKVFYFDQPKNDAYPVVQLKDSEKELKGFNWQIERRPSSGPELLTQELKQSQRRAYRRRPRTSFRQTERFFPGYMAEVRQGIYDARHKEAQPDTLSIPLDSLEALPDTLVAVPDTLVTSLASPDVQLDSLVVTPDSLALGLDSLSVRLDSLALGIDSLSVKTDSLAAMSDSLASASASLPAATDSTAVVVDKQDTVREKKPSIWERWAAWREKKAAEREIRWAIEDSLDALKEQKALEKQLEKKRNRTYRQLLQLEKEKKREERELQKYIEKYERQLARKRKKRLNK